MLTIKVHHHRRLRRTALASLAMIFSFALLASADDKSAATEVPIVDFERHVAPLFGRLGCNSAACHGAFGGGRGGLQLSLFGYSAKMDYLGLNDRIDKSNAESSLLLQKPSGQEEHEGGQRFKPHSQEYETIRRWISQGAKWQQGSGKVKALTVDPRQIVFDDRSTSNSTLSTRTANDSAAATTASIAITAEFADGSREIVTQLCRFSSRDDGIAVVEPSGRIVPTGHGDTSVIVSYGNAFAAVTVLVPFTHVKTGESTAIASESNSIDARIHEKLTQLNLTPSSPSTDEEFLRRVMIDTIGTIPTAPDVVEFCADSDPGKREKTIDALLAHPMHSALWATRMCDITKCDVGSMGEDQVVAARRAQMWHDWFRKRFENNTSYAEVVRDVITATSREGLDVANWIKQEQQLILRSRESFDSDYASRKTLDLYWRRVGADSEATLKSIAELTAVAFTGVRLNCAQCHKHPFDRWTQDDYAAFANIFAPVVYGSSTETNAAIIDELDRRREMMRADKSLQPLPRLREVFVSRELGRGISGSEPGVDVSPRVFDSAIIDNNVIAENCVDTREQFYRWLVASDNPYFARSFVNRVWSVYFGIGIVDPVDDFSVANPPSHPKLLNELAARFRETGFNIRDIEKRILMSATYQRSSTPHEFNRNDRRNFSRQYVRPLLAEVALDAINKALGTSEDFGELARKGSLAIEVGTNQLSGDAERALQVFGRGHRKTICNCDRRNESDLRQFIFLVNDPSIVEKIKRGSIRKLLSLENESLVSQLYLRMLGRRPDAQEMEFGLKHLDAGLTRDVAFDDLVWAMLNSREFITNH